MRRFCVFLTVLILAFCGNLWSEKSWAEYQKLPDTEKAEQRDDLLDFTEATQNLQKVRGYFEGRQNKNALSIAIADNHETRAKGLMFVGILQANEAMYFKFPDIGAKFFWMKSTYVPLDMIFLDANNVILHIEKMAQPHDLTPRGTDKAVAAVLELKGGQGELLGLRLGDKLILEGL